MKRLFYCVATLFAAAAATAAPPVNEFTDQAAPRDWVLLGTLPNPGRAEPVRDHPADSLGLVHDFLPALGGEAHARFEDGQAVEVSLPDGSTTNLTARAARIENAELGLPFDALFERPTDHRVAYAFTIVESGEDQTAWAEFGSDDGAAVWVNGEEVHRFDRSNRGIRLGDELFPIALKAGRNFFVVKAENGIGGWGFAMRLLSPATYEAAAARKRVERKIGRAQDAGLALSPPYGYCLESDTFPEVAWENPELLEELYGELSTTVRWFNASLEDVETAETPGRYAGYIETRTAAGPVLRRSFTLFRAHPGLEYWRTEFPLEWRGLPTFEIDPATWQTHQADINRWAARTLSDQLGTNPRGPMLLCALWERDQALKQDPGSQVPRWWRPDVADMEYHLALRAKVTGVPTKDRLGGPTRIEVPAPVLEPGTEGEAGFKAGAVEAIDAVCAAWAEETGVPFNVCIARNNRIILNRGYGRVNEEPVTAEDRFEIASLAKFQTGILLTQFLDQELLDLQDPIGRYLPDLPTEGPKVMTLRMCMSHTAGTEGHGNWGGFTNPWFDNIVAMGLAAYEPGTRYEYNGLSLNLAGRVMEVVSGRSFPRLMEEQLYGPLGCGPVEVTDTSFGTRIAAQDLAKVAQMLINRGAYGDRRFFRPEAMAYLMPVRLGDAVPSLQGLDRETRYGLGCGMPYEPYREDVPEEAPKEERSLLGPMLNHGSATGSMMRTGLGNDLIIAMARQSTGPSYEQHTDRLLRVVGEYLE